MMPVLPYKRADQIIEGGEELSWLVEGLWGEAAVGILGGEPKCCKSFLALDIAVAVASGQPCLDRYPVKKSGRVVLYAAEDSPSIVKSRLTGIAAARGTRLSELDIQVITVERLRLDQKDDILNLAETVEELRPKLLILDPFVRLHRIDENSSSEVSGILDNLRTIQRQFQTAIMIVHHAKKNSGKTRAGQALRGSSEFHAWGDSNLYMRRSSKDQLVLSAEHRAAPSLSGIHLELKVEDDKLALAVQVHDPEIAEVVVQQLPVSERIVTTLNEQSAPVTMAALRDRIGVRTATFYQALKELVESGRVKKDGALYALATQ